MGQAQLSAQPERCVAARMEEKVTAVLAAGVGG